MGALAPDTEPRTQNAMQQQPVPIDGLATRACAPDGSRHLASLVVSVDGVGSLIRLKSALEARGDCSLGDPIECRLPVVVDSVDASAAEEATRAIGKLPGVMLVDVVAMVLEDGTGEDSCP